MTEPKENKKAKSRSDTEKKSNNDTDKNLNDDSNKESSQKVSINKSLESSGDANKVKDAPQNDKSYEDGVIDGLQQAILAIMEKNGNVTDQMRNDVYGNRHHDSLINWVKSFIR